MSASPYSPTFTSRFAGRRRLLGTLAASASLLLVPGLASAQTWRQHDVVAKAIGDAPVSEEGLDISLPLVAEDGSAVPLTITSSLPDNASRIQQLAIFATANPTPEVAKFEFSADIPAIKIATRIRLSESQTVVVVARTEDGKTLVAQRDVRVTTSGCIAPAQPDTSNEMNARVRVPKAWDSGSADEIITMITHPMTTGLAQDAAGHTPPQRIINALEVALNDRPVIQATFFRSLAANPYLRFEALPQESGQMRFTWTEDTGRSIEETARIQLS